MQGYDQDQLAPLGRLAEGVRLLIACICALGISGLRVGRSATRCCAPGVVQANCRVALVCVCFAQAGHWRACVEPMLAGCRLIRLYPEVHGIDFVFVCCWT